MLKRIICKSNRLRLLDEVTDAKDLPSVIENSEPEWVIVSLTYDHVIPAWVDAYMVNQPSVGFLATAADGSKIMIKWLEVHEQELNGLSLNDLLNSLENRPVTP